jgi:hypothetical protein
MPRAKVDPRFRRRVAHACGSCKKRKSKCNGVLPCEKCKARRVGDSCRYSRDTASQPRSEDGRGTPRESHDTQIRVDLTEIERASPSFPSPKVPVTGDSPSTKESQMLKDSKGKFSMFHSLLQSTSR